jgi:hypothetical protein
MRGGTIRAPASPTYYGHWLVAIARVYGLPEGANAHWAFWLRGLSTAYQT